MKLGIGSYAYYWAMGVPGYPPSNPMTALQFLDRAAAHGVHLVQVADNLPLHTLDNLDEFHTHANALGIAVEVGTRGIAPDLLHTYLRLAQRFGTNIVRTIPDTADHHPSVDEIIGTLKDIAPEFAAAGVYLALENYDRFKSAEMAQMVEQIGSDHVGICLDTVNSFGSLEGPEIVVATLGPFIVNLHIKEFTIQRASYVMGFELMGKPAGQGMLNIPWLLDQLKGREFNAILELWPPPEVALAATIAKEERWVRESIAYLRQYITR
jgi:3-oxoisoapionate decarboxylase